MHLRSSRVSRLKSLLTAGFMQYMRARDESYFTSGTTMVMHYKTVGQGKQFVKTATQFENMIQFRCLHMTRGQTTEECIQKWNQKFAKTVTPAFKVKGSADDETVHVQAIKVPGFLLLQILNSMAGAPKFCNFPQHQQEFMPVQAVLMVWQPRAALYREYAHLMPIILSLEQDKH